MNDDPVAHGTDAPAAGADAGSETVAPGVLDRLAQALGPTGAAAVQKIVLIYLRETPGRFIQMCAAVENGDAEALWRAAHSMKSSSASVGAMRFAAMCEALEALGRGGALAGAATAIEAARSEYEQVHAALRRRLPGD